MTISTDGCRCRGTSELGVGRNESYYDHDAWQRFTLMSYQASTLDIALTLALLRSESASSRRQGAEIIRYGYMGNYCAICTSSGVHLDCARRDLNDS